MKRVFQTATIVMSLALTSGAIAQTKGAKEEAFRVDTKSSVVNWLGKKVVGGQHIGTLNFKEGTVTFKDGNPVKAEVVVDMNTLKDTDLKDPEWNQKLVGHLKSDDFFSVDKFPQAKLTINNFVKKGDKYELKGDLSIKGITKPVTFTAVESTTKAGRLIKADLKFDRTLFDVRYGSGKFFENLGDKMISDEISLEATIQLEPNAKTAAN